MKKKSLFVTLLATMMLLMTACGEGNTNTNKNSNSNTGEEASGKSIK